MKRSRVADAWIIGTGSVNLAGNEKVTLLAAFTGAVAWDRIKRPLCEAISISMLTLGIVQAPGSGVSASTQISDALGAQMQLRYETTGQVRSLLDKRD